MNNQNILLVEDNPADARLIREMLAEHLGGRNLDLRVGQSVSQALVMIDERLPDIVLLDLSVSDSFGLDTLYKIQNRSHTLPVIVLTGNQDEKLALKAVKAGAQDYLAKHELTAHLLVKTMQYARERKLNEASLRTSEARFRSLVELSSDWYWEQDATHILTVLSEGLSDKCGIDPRSLTGRRWWDVQWCASGNNDWAALRAAMEAGEPFQDIVVCCGGTPALHISISGLPVIEHGTFVGYRGIGKDVSARESTAAAVRGSEERFRGMVDPARDGVLILEQLASLSALKSEAERANAAKSRFMAAVSHDLRQPMHALMLFLDNLKNAELPAPARQIAAQMDAALHSTQLLLDSILVMSRLDNGMIAPSLSPFAIQPLLDRLRPGFEELARQKGLSLRIRPSAAVVHSDIALLERILSNLLSNALRYTDKGGVVVTCRKRRTGLLIQVWDTGRGIPVEHQESVFQEFFRLERANEDGTGIGLGLTIVRSCSTLLNSAVQLRSVPGGGSRFSLTVPFGQVPANPIVHEDELESEDGTRFAGLRVLLVDNDTDILQGTCTLLQRWGCAVIMARSGPQADAVLETCAFVPDLVISDLRLDDGELGTDLVMRMRRKYRPNLPAVLVSGDTSLQTARLVRRHGLKLLYKPLPPSRLRAVIGHLLSE